VLEGRFNRGERVGHVGDQKVLQPLNSYYILYPVLAGFLHYQMQQFVTLDLGITEHIRLFICVVHKV
jgi:hypothetical protein